jgi:N-acylneuraminate cytidylyltransferase
MRKVTAIIPVRGGSQRLKDKNLRLIGGESLLAKKIRILKDCTGVGEIVVNSDSDRMLAVAEKNGVKAVKRDEEYASSSTSTNDAIFNVVSNSTGDHVMWAQVTSPLLSAERIDHFIAVYFKKTGEGYDSLTTYKPLKEYIWDDDGPINYASDKHVNSQDLPPYKALTFSLMIIGREDALRKRYYIGDNPFFVEVTREEAVDIDDEYDLFIANSLLSRQCLLDIYDADGGKN